MHIIFQMCVCVCVWPTPSVRLQFLCLCAFVCVHVFVIAGLCACVQTCVCVCVCACVRTRAQTCAWEYALTQTRVCIHWPTTAHGSREQASGACHREPSLPVRLSPSASRSGTESCQMTASSGSGVMGMRGEFGSMSVVEVAEMLLSSVFERTWWMFPG